MKFQPALFIFLSFILIMQSSQALASAMNDSETTIEGFESKASVGPPLLPTEQPNDIFNIRFILKNQEGQPLSSSHIIINLENTRTKEKVSSLQFRNDGVANMNLQAGRWSGTLGVDEGSVLGSDYFANMELTVSKDSDVAPALMAVGSVLGEVYDKKGRLVSNANIKVECKQYISLPILTDDFGTFLAEYLALGNCTTKAMHEKEAGFASVNIEAGKPAKVRIILDKEVAGGNSKSLIIAGLIFVTVMAILLTTFVSRMGHQKKEKRATIEIVEKTKSKEEAEGKQLTNTRINDVIKTLKEREKAVVQFLLQNNNECTQAKIRYGTNVPKTSLMRIFDSLAARNIIEVQKFGKAKKIRLTDWLLGKEDEKERELKKA